MADVQMYPWMRRVQQSYWFQKGALPLTIGFGTSLVLQGCLAGGLAHLSSTCVWAAGDGMLTALITSWLQGHSPGSANFKSNGEAIPAVPKLKEMADNVVALQAAAKDPAIPAVNQADANKASNVVDKISADVSLNNAIIKSTLENAEGAK